MSSFASAPPREPRCARGLVWLFRRVLGVYFRKIEVTGNLPGADTGGRIFVSNHTNGIVDALLVLTTAPCRIAPIAKATLWGIPGLRWLLDHAGAVPVVRRRDDPTKAHGSNDEVFDKVAHALAAGHNILIFPEGTSHNEPHLIELKTGAARMLARARERGGAGLTFQAVGLEFEDRDLFRSRSLLVYGPVRSVDEIAERGDRRRRARRRHHRRGARGPRGAPRRGRLVARASAHCARRRDAQQRRRRPLARALEHHRPAGRGRGQGAARRRRRPRSSGVGDAVGHYYERLDEEGLADEQLAQGGDPGTVDTVAGRGAPWLSLPLAVAGAVLYVVPYELTHLLAQRIADEPDELSTYKIGVGLLAYPIWAAGLVAGGLVLLPPPLSAGFAVGSAVTSPFAALAWRDAGPRMRRAVRFATRAHRLAALRALRAEAIARVEQARADLGM